MCVHGVPRRITSTLSFTRRRGRFLRKRRGNNLTAFIFFSFLMDENFINGRIGVRCATLEEIEEEKSLIEEDAVSYFMQEFVT